MSELKLEVLLEPEKTGESLAEMWRRGISRVTYYEYRRRYELEVVIELKGVRPLGGSTSNVRDSARSGRRGRSGCRRPATRPQSR
jgi:hypothetical protein